MYEDTVVPIEASGQLVTWQGEHRINDWMRLELAPGHTPGSSVLWLDDGDGAVFVGDFVHTPAQLLRPRDSCGFDLDPDAASRSRGYVLAQAARSGTTLFPAHVAG